MMEIQAIRIQMQSSLKIITLNQQPCPPSIHAFLPVTEIKKLFLRILRNLSGHIQALKSEESFRSAEGVLFRKGIDKPFTGRVVERSPKGEVLLEASYLDGLPHGQQLRRFPDGAPALEAIFDRGVLSGVKTRWWTNGEISEEEYWSDGEFRGRRLWDDQGRLLKEEMIPGN